ncbi:MAG: MarR family winged helix-turn-helix transcriptional regulator [Bythopirellula sp.]
MNPPPSPCLDTICQQIALGRQLAQRLAKALRGRAVLEVEFRLLWLLSRQAARRIEQRSLAQQLGVSPAQVSSVVDKLRRQQFIESIPDETDRRRQHWQLTRSGQQQFQAIVAEVQPLLEAAPGQDSNASRLPPSQAEAA